MYTTDYGLRTTDYEPLTTDFLMFIPRGKSVHENLATSYVKLDALVADLGEGGFSGVVEVVLRETDSFVVINNGTVAAVLEKRGSDEESVVHPADWRSARDSYSRTTLADLAERAGQERGRLSIYGYAADTASAVARRINAQTLYVGLSSDFTDLEKMMLKLVRESDREWFVDINNEGIPTALIHMRDGTCRVFNSEEPSPDDASHSLDSENNKALGRLLYECNQPGTTFDVYFAPAGEAAETEPDRNEVEAEPASTFRSIDDSANPPSTIGSIEDSASPAEVEVQVDDDSMPESESIRPIDLNPGQADWELSPLDLIEHESNTSQQIETLYNVRAAAANRPGFELTTEVASPGETVSYEPAMNLTEADALHSSAESEGLPTSADAETMTEVKRLMGEIVRAIEEAAQAVAGPESFSMSLRAAQLKIADQYPFLDPFAGEIEYLAGEIVFVGQATVEEFISGLTEAVTLAVQTVMKSTAYPDRFRAYLTEDLKKLLVRERQGLEDLGLDHMIDQIASL